MAIRFYMTAERGRWVSDGRKCVGVGMWACGGPGLQGLLYTVITVSTQPAAYTHSCKIDGLDTAFVVKCAYVKMVALVHVIRGSSRLLQPSYSLSFFCALQASKITPIHLLTVTHWLWATGRGYHLVGGVVVSSGQLECVRPFVGRAIVKNSWCFLLIKCLSELLI